MSEGSVIAVNSGTMPQQQSPPPSSNGLEEADDWTRMKDPRAKKRAQNRVAQRFYRQRMKARLEELESKLRMHEQGVPGSSEQPSDPMLPGNDPTIPHDEPPVDPSYYSPRSQTSTTQYQIPMNNAADSKTYQHENVIGSNDHSSPQPSSRSGRSKSQLDLSQVNVTTTHSNGSVVSVFPATLPPTATAPAFYSNTIQDIPMIDPAQAAPVMNGTVYAHHGLSTMPYPNIPEWTGAVHIGSHPEQAPQQIAVPVTTTTTIATWQEQTPEQQPRRLQPQTTTTSSPAAAAATLPPPPGPNATIQARVEYFREGARAMGFDDLDALAETYYTAKFGQDSALANLQRISRNRHLPGLLATLRAAAKDWTDWERRGFDQEMVRGAEEILVDECNSFTTMKQFDNWLGPEGGAAGGPTGSVTAGGTPSAVMAAAALQDELPNLWALLTALCAENAALSGEERSKAVSQVVSFLCGPATP